MSKVYMVHKYSSKYVSYMNSIPISRKKSFTWSWRKDEDVGKIKQFTLKESPRFFALFCFIFFFKSRIKMQVRHESEQTQKVPRSLQHLKTAGQFHVGEVRFSERQIENRTCLFRFCHSLGDVQECSMNSEGEEFLLGN